MISRIQRADDRAQRDLPRFVFSSDIGKVKLRLADDVIRINPAINLREDVRGIDVHALDQLQRFSMELSSLAACSKFAITVTCPSRLGV